MVSKRIRKFGLVAAGLFASATMVAPAGAAVTINSIALDSPGGVNGTITYTPPDPDYVISAGIGRIKLSTNLGDIQSYCVDIFHSLTSAAFTASAATPTLTLSQVSKLSALISHGESLVTDADHSAAQQLAVWEIMFEGTGTYNLSGGDLKVATSANAISLANGYLANIANNSWSADPNLTLAVLKADNNQTQIVWGANASKVLAAVPEPATWAMMVIGFGAIGGAMRRRQAATPVRIA